MRIHNTTACAHGCSGVLQDCQHRRPYESLLLCWPEHLPVPGAGTAADGAIHQGLAAGAAAAAGAPGGSGFHLLQERPLVVAAVPPAAHSRKPHIGALLQPLLPPGARCLEVRWRTRRVGQCTICSASFPAVLKLFLLLMSA